MSRSVSALLKRVLMVPPQHFSVEYNINPWMGGTVDKTKAMEQWHQLKTEIERKGVQVLTLDQKQGLPDMVFVCNSGIALGDAVYLSKFRHPERSGEQTEYIDWYRSKGFRLVGDDYPHTFEGGGDACFSDYNTLWAGFGPRTDKTVYDNVRKLGQFDVILCELVDPRFYHLDTCFAPVTEKCALWYPPAFTAKTRDEILRRLPDSIAVDDKEAEAFVCNAITVRDTVISPPGVSAKTRAALARLGISVVEVEMSEFMKSGGACQCLVMKL